MYFCCERYSRALVERKEVKMSVCLSPESCKIVSSCTNSIWERKEALLLVMVEYVSATFQHLVCLDFRGFDPVTHIVCLLVFPLRNNDCVYCTAKIAKFGTIRSLL